MGQQLPPTEYLQLAFNRCLLRAQGYTLEKALAVPAIAKSLARVASNLQKPARQYARAYVD